MKRRIRILSLLVLVSFIFACPVFAAKEEWKRIYTSKPINAYIDVNRINVYTEDGKEFVECWLIQEVTGASFVIHTYIRTEDCRYMEKEATLYQDGEVAGTINDRSGGWVSPPPGSHIAIIMANAVSFAKSGQVKK